MEKQKIEIETKECKKCQRNKPLDQFYRHKTRGYQYSCKKCSNASRWKNGRFRDNDHKREVLASNRASYRRNQDTYSKRVKARRLERKAKAIAVLGEPICGHCHHEFHPVALDFHHRNPQEKLFNITSALGEQSKYSWEVIVAEIQKCDLICACCHRIVHYGV